MKENDKWSGITRKTGGCSIDDYPEEKEYIPVASAALGREWF